MKPKSSNYNIQHIESDLFNDQEYIEPKMDSIILITQNVYFIYWSITNGIQNQHSKIPNKEWLLSSFINYELNRNKSGIKANTDCIFNQWKNMDQT